MTSKEEIASQYRALMGAVAQADAELKRILDGPVGQMMREEEDQADIGGAGSLSEPVEFVQAAQVLGAAHAALEAFRLEHPHVDEFS